jgi:CubicO group peptidase (beta-lactamase class C family)
MATFKRDQLPDALAQARIIVQTEMAPFVPGLSVAVAIDGTTIWSEGFGHSDLANKIPVTPATRFRIGSVSKPLTAAGLALLVERNQLDLDVPVQTYIPDFPEKEGPITSRLLAGHLTGIRNYRGREAASNLPYPNLRSGLKIFEDDPLENPPGTKFSYASYNYNILGVVVEAAAQENFLAFMEQNVIGPLGLAQTRPDHAGAIDPDLTKFYETWLNGNFIPSPSVNLSYGWPSGGYLSTAEDLVRFGNAHLQQSFLKLPSLKLLFTSQMTSARKPTHYGIGWFVGRDIVYHGGDSFGGTAILLLRPASRTVVAVTANGGMGLLRNAILRGRAPQEAKQFLFNKAAIAHRLAKVFAPLFNKSAPLAR